METYTLKITHAEYVTHNVRRFRLEKPEGFSFEPGQATEVSINKPDLKDEKRPFTFTSLSDDPYLEFTIKIYADHDGVTKALGELKEGDELIIEEAWGAITYKGTGDFIAGGAGVTPFIAILRDLSKKGQLEGNRLIFSNKTSDDIILKEEFSRMLDDNFINTLTEEDHPDYDYGHINKDYLKEKINDFSKQFYVCGPPSFVEDIQKALEELGASSDSVVIEE